MNRDGLDVEIKGLPELIAKLSTLPAKVRKTGMRRAIAKATTPIVKRAKQLVPRRTGLLKKSLGRKIKSYSSTGNVIAVIGARTSYKAQTKTPGGKTRWHVPAKIFHLVEKGHGGKHPAPAKPSLEPAMEQTVKQAEQIFADGLRTFIDAQAAKP